MFESIKAWVERVLEKPFYDAEIIKVEILKENKTINFRLPKNLLIKFKEIHH